MCQKTAMLNVRREMWNKIESWEKIFVSWNYNFFYWLVKCDSERWNNWLNNLFYGTSRFSAFIFQYFTAAVRDEHVNEENAFNWFSSRNSAIFASFVSFMLLLPLSIEFWSLLSSFSLSMVIQNWIFTLWKSRAASRNFSTKISFT
jgi:hypothetical protein